MDIRQCLEYDAWATSQLLEAVASLTPDQFTSEFAQGTSSHLSSVRQQFVHLLSVADRYRARLMEEEVPDVEPEHFASPLELIAYAVQVRRRLDGFVAGLENGRQKGRGQERDRLASVQEHATRKGVFRASVEQTLQHMVLHATYHRGQIACLLKLQGIDFPDTDFIIWLNRSG